MTATSTGRSQPAGNRVLRICLHTHSYHPSGMGQHMLHLARAWAACHRVVLACRRTEHTAALLADASASGVTAVPLPGARDSAYRKLLAATLSDNDINVFHDHCGIGWEMRHGVEVARDVGVTAVVRTQHLPFALRSSRKAAAYLHQVPLLDTVIAVSHGVAATYERIGVPRDAIRVIPNGVPAPSPRRPRDVVRTALSASVEHRVVLTAGRLVRQKGMDLLVDAFAEVHGTDPRSVLVIAGDGPEHAALRSRADRLGVSSAVRFLGHRDDIADLLVAADLFVLPSRAEGLPLVVLEAMASGLPVVGTRVCGNDEAVVDGVTGFLAHPNAASLAAAMLAVLADEKLRSAMGGAARCRYEREFGLDRMVTRTLAVHEALLCRRDGAGPPPPGLAASRRP